MRWYLNHLNNKSPLIKIKQNKYIIESRGYPAFLLSNLDSEMYCNLFVILNNHRHSVNRCYNYLTF